MKNKPVTLAGAILGLFVAAAAPAQETRPATHSPGNAPETRPAEAAETEKAFSFPAEGEFPVIGQEEIENVIANHGRDLLVVNFWASWCAPCVAEMPYFQKSYEAHKDAGVTIVGLGLDMPIYEDEWRENADAVLERLSITYPQYQVDIDPAVTMPWFSDTWQGNLPATFYYNAEGEKLGERLGAIDHETLEADIEKYLAQAADGS